MEESNLQVAEQLILRAKKGEHSEFEFLRSIEEYFAARTVRNAVYKVAKSFKNSRDNLYKSYIKTVKSGAQSLEVILAISELEQVVKFYDDEIGIISDMIDEYVAYVHSGHIIDTLVGNYRKEEDLFDFREVGWFSVK